MRQSPKTDNTPQSDSAPDALIVLIRDMADTTWRMFMPIVGLLLVGRYADSRWDTKPFMMLLGALLGAVIAAALIKRQLRKGQ